MARAIAVGPVLKIGVGRAKPCRDAVIAEKISPGFSLPDHFGTVWPQ